MKFVHSRSSLPIQDASPAFAEPLQVRRPNNGPGLGHRMRRLEICFHAQACCCPPPQRPSGGTR